MDQTAERNGVLVFVAMKKRCFEIVADQGIDEKVSPELWAAVAALISERIDRDGFAEGLSTGILRIGEILAEHFPGGMDDPNQLPNRPTLS
jgi:putative membrane protein